MNEGIYQSIRILEEETIELMHTIQPDNSLQYGLAWMDYPISLKYSAMGHGGDIMGVDTWMLYMPSEDIGIIYFANGNPAYGENPLIGSITIHWLLYLLFKEGGFGVSDSSNIINYYNSFSTNINAYYFAK